MLGVYVCVYRVCVYSQKIRDPSLGIHLLSKSIRMLEVEMEMVGGNGL